MTMGGLLAWTLDGELRASYCKYAGGGLEFCEMASNYEALVNTAINHVASQNSWISFAS
jgi:hypothetical protein